MNSVMAAYINRLLFSQKWNIGFSNISPQQLINGEKIEIMWLKHSFNDRFFADPFILMVGDKEIVILAEELIFLSYSGRRKVLIEEPKGKIVKLIVNRKTLQLKERVEILELDSHISFPNILRINNAIYVYPETSDAGKLNLYKYESNSSQLRFEKTIIDEPLIDSCIFFYNGFYWLTATKKNLSQRELYIYYSTKPFGGYNPIEESPVFTDEGYARSAGNIFCANGHFYRPGQDCSKNYGGGIIIQEIKKLDLTGMLIINSRKIYPTSSRYNLGIHTINFSDNLCVVDGVGYLHPVYGYLYNYYCEYLKKIS
jgi:hypothetical protein